jgi:hypothetical protein
VKFTYSRIKSGRFRITDADKIERYCIVSWSRILSIEEAKQAVSSTGRRREIGSVKPFFRYESVMFRNSMRRNSTYMRFERAFADRRATLCENPFAIVFDIRKCSSW